MPVIVSAFYKFVTLTDTASLRGRLLEAMQARSMKGTILLAPEGINGTVSAPADEMPGFLNWLRQDARFGDLVSKDATAPTHPFKRLKVKLKNEIISFRQQGANPALHVGTYVAPENWNALISDPDIVVLDTRNTYEVEAGTFRGAIDPKTRNFGELPQFVAQHLDPAHHKRVAMFCTGGIRCEKASAYFLSQGFTEVYHLEGGILNYLAKVPAAESLFEGRCFVFDERDTVA